MRKAILVLLLFLKTAALAQGEALPAGLPQQVPVYGYRVLDSYPHDRDAFTQGLFFSEGVLFESTGLNGASSIRRVDLTTGAVLQSRALPYQYFGEGATVIGKKIIQLTWRSREGFVYDRDTLALLRTFTYAFEGWGLTSDGTQLIASDGSATLRFLDPESFVELRRLEVVDRSGPVSRLNELEYVGGRIFANVWQTERIAIIDPGSGRVTGWLDLRGLLSAQDRLRPVDVLNGIAYDRGSDRFYVTGKLWPRLFAIEPVPALDR